MKKIIVGTLLMAVVASTALYATEKKSKKDEKCTKTEVGCCKKGEKASACCKDKAKTDTAKETKANTKK